jgi:Predicted nucleotide-binding protein containing TIR-like domain
MCVMKKPAPKPKAPAAKRTYLSQEDVPAHGLEAALRVPQAIADSYGKNPTKPLRLAEAMGVSPGSSGFRMLCGASIAYGLTDGGYNTDLISITPLGRRIVAPTKEGDVAAAKKEAFLRPRIIRDFLTRYNDSKIPAENIARNVLEEMGVPPDRTQATLGMLLEGARAVGVLRDLKGSTWVDLGAVLAKEEAAPPTDGESSNGAVPVEDSDSKGGPAADSPEPTRPEPARPIVNRVFITHGKNKEILGQIKELLTFGGFTPIIAIDQETVSKPVPDKVMDDMRTCSAAIIHVGTEMTLLDGEGREHKMLNQNVLIEIGAALALYGRKFILLVEQGATLPSNLQGLYEVRYAGAKLDYESTMKLLKAFNDFRS